MQAEKTVSVSANIIEDFASWTPEQMAKAPKVKFANTTYDFGTSKEGTPVEYDFVVTNEGENDLYIRKVKGGWGCTASNAEKSVLKKGESTKIHVTLATQGKAGVLSKNVTVITNDPVNTTTVLTIKGTVEKAVQ